VASSWHRQDAAAALLAAGERIDVLVLMDEEPAGRTTARPQDGDALDRMVAALPAAEATPGRRLTSAPIVSLSVTLAGLAALRSAPGVLAITKDGVVRPAGQVSTAFIGADRLFASGLRGDGRAAAIVDSGVDVFHPDLGGAAGTPSPRVLAGYNFAGKPGSEADLSDCSGHGTAVAGVIGDRSASRPGRASWPSRSSMPRTAAARIDLQRWPLSTGPSRTGGSWASRSST
jgi:subtilisin family serine protease